jgi:maltose alpha-D-glucosyltransferase/alpha-amylase
LEAIARKRRFKGDGGEIVALPSQRFRQIAGSSEAPLTPSPVKREQSNSSIVFGDRLILKMFRRLVEGVNPDLEIGRFITERTDFGHTPPFAGALECQMEKGEPITVGILQGFVQNQGDAWSYTLDSLQRCFESCLARRADAAYLPMSKEHVLNLIEKEIPPLAHEMIGAYIPSAELVGQRTAELHVALASDTSDPAFAPESFTSFYRRSLYQSMRTLAKQAFTLLQRRRKILPSGLQADAGKVLDLEKEVYSRMRSILDLKITALRTRHHGDYHLGQLLYTGKDFVVTDFEGEPARALSERRMKRSPLRDVAGMLRSFDYAAVSALKSGRIRAEDASSLEPWSRFWNLWVSVVFLKSYLAGAAKGEFLPKSNDEMKTLLDLYVLEKAIYELSYELNNRPEWVGVPIRGILEIVQPAS